MRRLYDFLASLDLGIWLVAGVMLFLGIGSFVTKEGSAINSVPLFAWLTGAPLSETWWLWATLVILALLALNTVLCSVESLRAKWQRGNFLVRIAPQLMHAGFLFIMLAHLISADGGVKDGGALPEGGSFSFPDGSRAELVSLDIRTGAMGMPVAFSGLLRHHAPTGEVRTVFSPNNPYFYGGYGVYLKHVEPFPVKTAMLEIHREPGAFSALLGGVLFTAANLVLLWMRRGRRQTASQPQ